MLVVSLAPICDPVGDASLMVFWAFYWLYAGSEFCLQLPSSYRCRWLKPELSKHDAAVDSSYHVYHSLQQCYEGYHSMSGWIVWDARLNPLLQSPSGILLCEILDGMKIAEADLPGAALKTKSAAILALLMQQQWRTADCLLLYCFTLACWACGDESKLMANAQPVEDC
ncbi:hypothetical protein Nepgr_020391 [Nepenthes gracilis]|uniref:Uncharacterized protein n=1 Tax=Nepenthes gracilis TaxID=150966 RepID=A0AAD3SWS2_NEPGR|nr:hypothetical protein Nepgr_020391 [Nepenthes gracilis]